MENNRVRKEIVFMRKKHRSEKVLRHIAYARRISLATGFTYFNDAMVLIRGEGGAAAGDRHQNSAERPAISYHNSKTVFAHRFCYLLNILD
jgi:hypothetical protein